MLQSKSRIAVNTITGGFSGGGETNAARKWYARQARLETFLVGRTSFPTVPDIAFTAEDGQGIMPHDDDPLVIQ
ncbi:hypothetical protein A2U01_0072395, partial [Trifolium medium]|nr:hypothetical protein [Trifolium medium]